MSDTFYQNNWKPSGIDFSNKKKSIVLRKKMLISKHYFNYLNQYKLTYYVQYSCLIFGIVLLLTSVYFINKGYSSKINR